VNGRALHADRVIAVVALAGCIILAGPALAQVAGKKYVIGAFAASGKSPGDGATIEPPKWFTEHLAREGFVVGKNLRIETVFGDVDLSKYSEKQADDLLQVPARRLLALNPDILVGAGGHDILARLTATVPIVYSLQAVGTLASLRKQGIPARNVTGVELRYDELAIKRLEAIRELLPKARRVAVIAQYPMFRSEFFPAALDAAADRLGLRLIHADIWAHDNDQKATLAYALRERADAFMPYGEQPGGPLSEFEMAHRIPYIDGGNCTEGSTLCYGEDWTEHRRRYVDIIVRILRGARPEDIPPDVTARFDVTVNLQRASHLGLRIPPSIMLRANRVFGGPQSP
jgi:putative tryptophan/tyrosine transport system substrate-binding protein